MGNNMHMSELYGSSKHWVSFTTLWHVKVGRRRLSEERRKDDGQKDKAGNKGWERRKRVWHETRTWEVPEGCRK